MFIEMVNTYGPAMTNLMALAIFGALGLLLGRFLNTATKQIIAKNAMLFVEHTFKDLHGEDKMLKALQAASRMLARVKIKFDATEMRDLIEAALGAFNNGVNKGAGAQIVATEEKVEEFTDAIDAPLNEAATAQAVSRPGEDT